MSQISQQKKSYVGNRLMKYLFGHITPSKFEPQAFPGGFAFLSISSLHALTDARTRGDDARRTHFSRQPSMIVANLSQSHQGSRSVEEGILQYSRR